MHSIRRASLAFGAIFNARFSANSAPKAIG